MALTDLTPREAEVFSIAIQFCLKDPDALKINYDALVKHGSFNTMKTAQNTWGSIKTKLFSPSTKKDTGSGNDDEEEPAATTSTPETKKRGRKPKGPATPSKRGKKAAAICSPLTDDRVVDEEDEEYVTVKKSKGIKTKETGDNGSRHTSEEAASEIAKDIDVEGGV